MRFGFFLVGNLRSFAVDLDELRVELRRNRTTKPREQMPVLFRDEGLNFTLTIAH